MKRLLTLLIIVSTTAIGVENQTTICSFGDQQRKIELIYAQGTLVPCEVQYTKASGMTVLWNAQSESGYCEQQYAAFIEKQSGWGWACEAITEQVNSVDEAESESEAMNSEPVHAEVEMTARETPVEDQQVDNLNPDPKNSEEESLDHQ